MLLDVTPGTVLGGEMGEGGEGEGCAVNIGKHWARGEKVPQRGKLENKKTIEVWVLW